MLGGIKGHHHFIIQMRMTHLMPMSSLPSKPQNTTTGGMLVFSTNRTFVYYSRYFTIQDGKKIYFKHAGVNQPA
jgi:hypothetical protein